MEPLGLLGDYDCYPSMMYGAGLTDEELAAIMRGLRAVDKYWKLRWILRERLHSILLINGPVTDHPSMWHRRGTRYDAVGGTCHGMHALISVPRLFTSDTQNVVAHEVGHLASFALETVGRQNVLQAWGNFKQLGYLTRVEAEDVGQLLAETYMKDVLGFPIHHEVRRWWDTMLATTGAV